MRRTGIGIIRHLVAAAAVSACTLTAIPALAEVKVWRSLPRPTAAVAMTNMLRPSAGHAGSWISPPVCRSANVPGAGGTIGLSQFVTARKHNQAC